MPRPLRIDYPGAFLHITNRGRNHQDICQDDGDRDLLLEHLATGARQAAVEVHAYSIMDTHFHLLLRSLKGNVSLAMQIMGGRYTQDTNTKYGNDGAIFKGRFFSKVIDSESYLLEAFRYIPNNAVKAGIVDRAQDYRYSSYAATLGLVPAPKFLSTTTILDEYFNSDPDALDAFVRARDTRQSALFAHVVEACSPDQVLSEAVGQLDEAIRGLTECRVRSAQAASERDALMAHVSDAFGVDLFALASPRSERDQHARLALLTLFQRRHISPLGDLATAFGFARADSARRAIRQFEAAAADPNLAAILERGLLLFARAS